LSLLQASFQRSNSHDKVRKIVAEEGRAARNLIAWSVPVESKEEEAKSKIQGNSNARAQRINSGLHRNKKQNLAIDCKNVPGSILDKGSEKSPTKTRQPRKVDLRARYWAFLFDNLRRAVDEIYVTCESDQSVVECRSLCQGTHYVYPGRYGAWLYLGPSSTLYSAGSDLSIAV
ncbi:S phase cyclin A-associated protein in the endoplasmic reticulum, partial [Anabarilius grahami]